MSFTIALPKGRLGEEAEEIFLKAKIFSNPIKKDSRKLIFNNNKGIKIILVRAWDVPAYVEMGTADIGVCGKDDLIEHEADLLELLDLGFGYCRMTLAGKKGLTKEKLFSRYYVKVATKYPNIARKFFSKVSIQPEIIKLYGSVELAAITGMSDCIVDIVSTGRTLEENGLCIIEELFKSTARLVANRSSFYLNLDYFQGLIKGITELTHKA